MTDVTFAPNILFHIQHIKKFEVFKFYVTFKMLISNTGGIFYKLTHAVFKGYTAKTKVPLLQNTHTKSNWNVTTNPSTVHFCKHMCSSYEHIYIYIYMC